MMSSLVEFRGAQAVLFAAAAAEQSRKTEDLALRDLCDRIHAVSTSISGTRLYSVNWNKMQKAAQPSASKGDAFQRLCFLVKRCSLRRPSEFQEALNGLARSANVILSCDIKASREGLLKKQVRALCEKIVLLDLYETESVKFQEKWAEIRQMADNFSHSNEMSANLCRWVKRCDEVSLASLVRPSSAARPLPDRFLRFRGAESRHTKGTETPATRDLVALLQQGKAMDAERYERFRRYQAEKKADYASKNAEALLQQQAALIAFLDRLPPLDEKEGRADTGESKEAAVTAQKQADRDALIAEMEAEAVARADAAKDAQVAELVRARADAPANKFGAASQDLLEQYRTHREATGETHLESFAAVFGTEAIRDPRSRLLFLHLTEGLAEAPDGKPVIPEHAPVVPGDLSNPDVFKLVYDPELDKWVHVAKESSPHLQALRVPTPTRATKPPGAPAVEARSMLPLSLDPSCVSASVAAVVVPSPERRDCGFADEKATEVRNFTVLRGGGSGKFLPFDSFRS